VTGRTDWDAIALLYEGLLLCAPTIGAQVGRAAALARARGDEAGLAAMDATPRDALVGYQPYWALRAHLLKRLGRADEAREAFSRAIGLTEDDGVRAFLAAEATSRTPLS
jgi:RNA polymerase sigma-70 factor (ECF subfamily)